MLSWFVDGFTSSNQLTPNYILVLFIVSVLAGAWALFTLIGYARTRHSGLFVAGVDLAFVGALIAGVYELRGITGQNCSNFSAGSFYVNLGPFGYYGRQSNSPWAASVNKPCAMLKASFAFGIMNIIFFFTTFVSLVSPSLMVVVLMLTQLVTAPGLAYPPTPQAGRSRRQARVPQLSARIAKISPTE